jgi:ABC-type Fe3+-siderophore transport system permease subunit
MKLLTTLILMTLSTIAFADVSVNDTNKTDFIYVSKKVHDELDAQYKGMIHSVNSNLYSKSLDEQSVKYESIKVVYENVNCDREGLEEIEWCELKRNELVEKLTADVMKSDLYQISLQFDARNPLFPKKTKMSQADQIMQQNTQDKINTILNYLMIAMFAITGIIMQFKFNNKINDYNLQNPDEKISALTVIICHAKQLIGFMIATGLLLAGCYFIFYTNIVLSFMMDYPSVSLLLLAIAGGIGYLMTKDVEDLKKD